MRTERGRAAKKGDPLMPNEAGAEPRCHVPGFSGELHVDGDVVHRHCEDASVYRIRPAAVAVPTSRDDVRAVIDFCRARRLTIHGWGAGTSRGGQPLGTGVVVDFRPRLKRILDYDAATGEVTVEPGVYYSELQKFLRGHGRSFPPDPSYHQCTVGGMVANNAAGIHSVKYGGTIEHVAAVEFFTSDGTLHHSERPDDLHASAHAFLTEHWSVIAGGYPRVEKNCAGYALHRGLTPEGRLDLPKLLTGSEGTLGLFIELRLRTVPLPQATALGVVYFATLAESLQAAMDLRRHDVAACELVDKALLDLHAAHRRTDDGPKHARRIESLFLDRFYEKHAEAVLIVEFDGESEEAARHQLRVAFEDAALRNAVHVYAPRDAAEIQAAWDLRRRSSPILNKLEDGRITIKPLWAVEDVSLPRENLLRYVDEQQRLFAEFGLVCSFFGHAASCNLHIDPVHIDPRVIREDGEIAALFDRVAAASYALVIRHGGSISGEHGDGLNRTPNLPLQYPAVYPLFATFKALFDPLGLCNPGKIVGEDRRRA